MHSTRYAHCEGYTDICLAESGGGNDTLVTCGEDGDVRVWRGFDDIDNTSIRVADKCSAVACRSGTIYAADAECNELRRYDLASGECQGTITAFTLPITSVQVNKSNTRLVCGSADFGVRVCELTATGASVLSELSGHEAPVLAVCYDPLEKYVASSACDGTLRFWSLQTHTCVKTLAKLHARSNDVADSPSWCRMAWHRDGAIVAVPALAEVHFYERETWLCKFKITLEQSESDSEQQQQASIVCFSPDGQHVLVAAANQTMYVHSIINKALLFKYAYSAHKRIAALVWCPATSAVVFCDTSGNMGLVKPTLKDAHTTDKKKPSATTTTTKNDNKGKSTASAATDEMAMEDLLDLLEASEDTNDSADVVVKTAASKKKQPAASKSTTTTTTKTTKTSNERELKSPSKKKRKRRVSDAATTNDDDDDHTNDNDHAALLGEDDGDECSSSASSKETKKRPSGGGSDEDDDDLDGEDDLESLEKLKKKTYNLVKREVMALDTMKDCGDEDDDDGVVEDNDFKRYRGSSDSLAATAAASALKTLTSGAGVAAFQASATPLTLAERYMVWNTVGVITQFNKEGDESIDVEFHNASYHHTIHIKNQFGYTMADVSKEAVVLASPGKDKDNESADNELIGASSSSSSVSKLTCIMLNSSDTSKEWSVDMPRKEYIRCVAAGGSIVACATSRRFVRLFSTAGTQRQILSVCGGSPVAIALHAAHRLLVAHAQTQHAALAYSLYQLESDNTAKSSTTTSGRIGGIEHGLVPTSEASAKIDWMGFSDEGNPYWLDSNGFLYTKCAASAWTPIANMRATLTHKSDTYWLVGVCERTQLVKAVLCKSGAKWPAVLPRPTISIVPMSMPLVEPESEKSQLEQDYWKNKYLSLAMLNYDCASGGSLDLDEDELGEVVDKFEASSREMLMKLFMLACKHGKEHRALEVAGLMDTAAMQLAVKYATKTRALVLAQNLNMLSEKRAEAEFREQQQQQQQQETYQSSSYYQSTSRSVSRQHRDDDSEVMIDTQATVRAASLASSTNMTMTNESMLSSTAAISSSCLTPTALPATAASTRLNPFAAKGANSRTATPLNDSSKSIINEIEEKMSKRGSASAAAGKDKDAWKPTPPTKKLIKSKVSSGLTPTGASSGINSFFTSPTIPKN